MTSRQVLCNTPHGLYCPAGDFYIDPSRSVEHAVITHAHSDHARPGMGRYTAHPLTISVLRLRMFESVNARPLAYGEAIRIKDATVSLHPAGHVIGSAQVRVEVDGEVWVVSGDYKRQPDPYAAPFEVVPCDVFITESTFALPIYRWQSNEHISDAMNTWWRANAARGVASVIFAYSLGKAQRVMGSVDATIGPIITHSSIENVNAVFRSAGISLPTSHLLSNARMMGSSLIIAPGQTDSSPWLRQAEPYTTAVASGWMSVRSNRLRRSAKWGFAMSDHGDWPDLVRTVRETGAKRILVTHGYSAIFVRWLCEQGYDAQELRHAL